MTRTLALAATLALATPAAVAQHDISFKGGTAKEYYNTLQETIPGIRLVVHPDVDYFMMPPVQLPDVSIDAAVWAAAKLVDGVNADMIPGASSEGHTYIVGASAEAVAAQLSAPTTFDLDFPGGSLEALVEELREVADANIILYPDAAGVPVLPMRLRRTTVWDVLGTVDREPLDRQNQLNLRSFMGPNEGAIYALQRGEAQQRQARMTTAAYSLAEILRRDVMNADEVIGAIETALETSGEEATIRYHEGTEVLIVHCPSDQSALVQQVLGAVQDTAHQRSRGE